MLLVKFEDTFFSFFFVELNTGRKGEAFYPGYACFFGPRHLRNYTVSFILGIMVPLYIIFFAGIARQKRCPIDLAFFVYGDVI